MNNNVFNGLEPKILWQHFEAFTKIARPSGKEEQMVTYIKAWAAQYNFSVKTDAVGNLAVSVPATPGFETKPIVVLQGHLDMVCEKNSDSLYDPELGKINVLKEGDWLKADGTTLGADNGVGVAAALSVAEDGAVKHGPLELLFTIDEETGMTGAGKLDPKILAGRLLLNLDSEDDKLLFVGCAGGTDIKITLTGAKEPLSGGWVGLQLTVSGLKGGHSGLDINNGRLNAIKTLVSLVADASANCLVAEISGGNKRNAIPREAKMIIAMPLTEVAGFKEKIEQGRQGLIKQYQGLDDGLEVNFEEKPIEKVFDQASSFKLLNLLRSVPFGVIGMSQSIKGLVETSTNFGVVATVDNQVELYCLLRSSTAFALAEAVKAHEALGHLAGAKVEQSGHYPGWQPNLASKTLVWAKQAFVELFGTEPEVTAIHAGLECGLIGQQVPGMDMVSFGPLALGAHAPGEQVSISSTQKFYQLLSRILEKIA